MSPQRSRSSSTLGCPTTVLRYDATNQYVCLFLACRLDTFSLRLIDPSSSFRELYGQINRASEKEEGGRMEALADIRADARAFTVVACIRPVLP